MPDFKFKSESPLLCFQLTVGDTTLIDRTLGFMIDGLNDLRPAFDKIRDSFVAHNQDVFNADGAVEGWSRWRDLNPHYAARKAQEGYDTRINRRTLQMVHSVTNKGDPNFIYRSSRYEMEVGTRDPKAIHIEKDKGRSLMRVGEAIRRQWVRILQRHVMNNENVSRGFFGK